MQRERERGFTVAEHFLDKIVDPCMDFVCFLLRIVGKEGKGRGKLYRMKEVRSEE